MAECVCVYAIQDIVKTMGNVQWECLGSAFNCASNFICCSLKSLFSPCKNRRRIHLQLIHFSCSKTVWFSVRLDKFKWTFICMRRILFHWISNENPPTILYIKWNGYFACNHLTFMHPLCSIWSVRSLNIAKQCCRWLIEIDKMSLFMCADCKNWNRTAQKWQSSERRSEVVAFWWSQTGENNIDI